MSWRRFCLVVGSPVMLLTSPLIACAVRHRDDPSSSGPYPFQLQQMLEPQRISQEEGKKRTSTCCSVLVSVCTDCLRSSVFSSVSTAEFSFLRRRERGAKGGAATIRPVLPYAGSRVMETSSTLHAPHVRRGRSSALRQPLDGREQLPFPHPREQRLHLSSGKHGTAEGRDSMVLQRHKRFQARQANSTSSRLRCDGLRLGNQRLDLRHEPLRVRGSLEHLLHASLQMKFHELSAWGQMRIDHGFGMLKQSIMHRR